jgi:hypothetical protein
LYKKTGNWTIIHSAYRPIASSIGWEGRGRGYVRVVKRSFFGMWRCERQCKYRTRALGWKKIFIHSAWYVKAKKK